MKGWSSAGIVDSWTKLMSRQPLIQNFGCLRTETSCLEREFPPWSSSKTKTQRTPLISRTEVALGEDPVSKQVPIVSKY